MEKLVVVVMGQNCERFIGMCLESVKEAEEIVFCDGGSEDNTKYIVSDFKLKEMKWKHIEGEGSEWDWHPVVIENLYDQEDKIMNSKQRNFYLDYLKENYPDYWALCLDADEVVEDLSKIKEFIQKVPPGLISVKMRHFQGDLGHEDATRPEHFVLNRLFKISEAGRYPDGEHPVLQPITPQTLYKTDCTTIWHLAYMPGMWEIKKRYENHIKKSEIHTKDELDLWYRQHLFGQYPSNQINLKEIPEVILKEFGIDKDEFYFQNRGLEIKHFIMFKQWLNYFNLACTSPRVLDLGCGLGPYGYVARLNNCIYRGVDLSWYAVQKNPFGLNLMQGDITKLVLDYPKSEDIVLCLDILEHLSYEDLDRTLESIKEVGTYTIFSIPFIGNTDLEKDKTHKIKETKEWWINKLSNYFKIEEAPTNWLYNSQLLIGKCL